MVDLDKEQYERDQGVGASSYHVTVLKTPSIDRPPTNYAKDLKTEAGPVLSVLDWIWTEFDVAGGKGFLDATISPLAGNYNSIEANGKAWLEVGKQFGEVAGNMGANAKTLATNHWEGPAAEAFGQFLEVYWKKGAAWAGEQIGLFLKKGFDKVAQFSKEIAELAVRTIKRIIKVAARIASRGIPFLGWARSALEFLAKLVGFDVDTLLSDVKEIIALFRDVTGLFTQIESLVESMKGYFTAFDQVIETVKRIPEVGSLDDAQTTYNEINEGATEMNKRKKEIEEKAAGADKQLEEIGSKAKGGK